MWGSASHGFLDLFSLQGDESTKVPESLERRSQSRHFPSSVYLADLVTLQHAV